LFISYIARALGSFIAAKRMILVLDYNNTIRVKR